MREEYLQSVFCSIWEDITSNDAEDKSAGGSDYYIVEGHELKSGSHTDGINTKTKDYS